jgi:hypothetical protein
MIPRSLGESLMSVENSLLLIASKFFLTDFHRKEAFDKLRQDLVWLIKGQWKSSDLIQTSSIIDEPRFNF